MMEPTQDWLDHLNIPTTQLEAWKLEAPEDVPLLVWCLREGKLKFEDYANWAKNHYSLPVIKPEFFSSSPQIEGLESTEWSPWMVPVAIWENLTYIGCVLPPEDREEGFVYLLADPKDLNNFYLRLEEESASDPKEDTNFNAPEGLILNLPPVIPQSSETQSSEIESPQEESSIDVEPPTQVTAVESAPAVEPPTAVTAIKPQGPTTTLQLAEWWNEAQGQFGQAVILKVEQNAFLPVWKNGSIISLKPLSSETPSLFRIALRTKKPYHGFVVDNPIHQSFFFEELSSKSYPSCVTAILIGEESSEHYIVVFFGYVGADGEELIQAEDLAGKLKSSLKSASQTKAA